MSKEEMLKTLLQNLLEKKLTKLEKTSNEQIKDTKLMNIFFKKQEIVIHSYFEDIKRRTMIKQKTSDDLKSQKRVSRLYTPSTYRRMSKSKDKSENKEKNNFSNLNKLKIDGKYKQKNNQVKKSNLFKNNNIERKDYITPIRRMHSHINSLSKIKKAKRHNNNTKDNNHTTKDNNNSIISNMNNKKNKTDLIESINRANKSFILSNKNNLNKSYNNNINNYSIQKKNNTLKKKAIKINIIDKQKKKLFAEQFDTNTKVNIIINKDNFGDWLCSDEGKEAFISISNYLDSKSKYNFFSCKKNCIKLLYRYIDDKYTAFKEKNKINPNTSIIQEKIEEIKDKYPENELNIDNKKFNLSIGTVKALDLLNKEIHLQFFDVNKYDSFTDDIYLVYKIIFQLNKNSDIKNLDNKKEFFEQMIKYIKDNMKENKVGNLFKEMVNNFDFSKENIYQIKNIIKGNEDKLKPKYYSKICSTTGLIIFLVKDILEYLGLNSNNKSNTAIILANLEFLEKMKSKIPNYLKILQKYIMI